MNKSHQVGAYISRKLQSAEWGDVAALLRQLHHDALNIFKENEMTCCDVGMG